MFLRILVLLAVAFASQITHAEQVSIITSAELQALEAAPTTLTPFRRGQRRGNPKSSADDSERTTPVEPGAVPKFDLPDEIMEDSAPEEEAEAKPEAEQETEDAEEKPAPRFLRNRPFLSLLFLNEEGNIDGEKIVSLITTVLALFGGAQLGGSDQFLKIILSLFSKKTNFNEILTEQIDRRKISDRSRLLGRRRARKTASKTASKSASK